MTNVLYILTRLYRILVGMLDIFTRFIDTIFPPHQSVFIVRKLRSETFLKLFAPRIVVKIYTLAPYTHSHIKAAITANKFHDSQKAALLLAELFDFWYATQIPKPTLFVPIPLSAKREKQRGYNQVSRILQNSIYAEAHIVSLLYKKTDTPPQTSLPRKERLQNAIGMFTYKAAPELHLYHRIIVLDDVTTTGATMKEALKVLKKELGKTHTIIGVTIAH